jgi:FtsP/CotA-like multicopper oxidase with cupredoxin domain
MSTVSRRDFLRYAVVGAPVFAGGAVANHYLDRRGRAGGRRRFPEAYRFAFSEALVQMVDQTFVYHWAFEDLGPWRPVPFMPGPLIGAVAGDEIALSLTNTLPQLHGFRIPGVQGEVGRGVIVEPGETVELSFRAPAAGSYLYEDHLNAPVNRVLGLHGPMEVLPARGNTPYSRPTEAVQRLFDDLGRTEHFPGEPWHPDRTTIWVFNAIDPHFHERAEHGEEIDPEEFVETCLPRYFTINGLSGAYAAHDPSVVAEGRIGQPHLIRLLNAGPTYDSPHIHGNHVYILSRVDEALENRVQDNVVLVDTIVLKPQERMDWLLPFIRPQDIPGDPNVPLRELLREELSMTLGGVSQSVLKYPMHDHVEMAQTAAGGNYPQGAVTDWHIIGDLDGVYFPGADPTERGGENEEFDMEHEGFHGEEG